MSNIMQQKIDWDNFRDQYTRMENIGIEYYFLYTGKTATSAEVLEMTEYHFKVMVNEYGSMGSHNYETYDIPYSYLYNLDWQQEVKHAIEMIEHDKKLKKEHDRIQLNERKKEKQKQNDETERHLYEQLKKKFDVNL